MTTSLTSPISQFIDALWRLSDPERDEREEPRAIKINLEVGHRTVYHDTHPDAPNSPLYFNGRTKDNPEPGPLGVDEVGRAGLIFYEMLRHNRVTPTWICGIPNAGLPFGRALSQMTGIQHLELVKGTGRSLDFSGRCPLGSDDLVLVIDDVIAEADTKERAAELLGGSGAKVIFFVLLDRQQGGRSSLARNGYRLEAAFTVTELMLYLEGAERVGRSERDAVLAYPTILRNYQLHLPGT